MRLLNSVRLAVFTSSSRNNILPWKSILINGRHEVTCMGKALPRLYNGAYAFLYLFFSR